MADTFYILQALGESIQDPSLPEIKFDLKRCEFLAENKYFQGRGVEKNQLQHHDFSAKNLEKNRRNERKLLEEDG